ncbi:hypothetical protein K505DRAFT_28325 [Melanomma pulvis-pyrius CBS 109.77]|uniref:Uncharacterized protein n=1 Tax=Melanomma pulvis-pyrius CBS 109.77 TaxID=1314802 RepID=A0A6A6XF71_9PLEO|nr:hypothetical protein K505DRAFT_28325 [Melanomma pulvis-pyrius CBS 109.77]
MFLVLDPAANLKQTLPQTGSASGPPSPKTQPASGPPTYSGAIGLGPDPEDETLIQRPGESAICAAHPAHCLSPAHTYPPSKCVPRTHPHCILAPCMSQPPSPSLPRREPASQPNPSPRPPTSLGPDPSLAPHRSALIGGAPLALMIGARDGIARDLGPNLMRRDETRRNGGCGDEKGS